jgi:hypothetical protein
MKQFKLGLHIVRFEISRTGEQWRLTQQIGLDDQWDNPVEGGEFYADRRKAKNVMYHQLKKLRADQSYY